MQKFNYEICFLGDYSDSEIPIYIPFPSSPIIRFISCGFFHCAAISNENCVYTWGGGLEGQLGHGDNLNLSIPKKIVSFASINSIKSKEIKGNINSNLDYKI